MQFVWLNKQGVASDQGFVLQSMDRTIFEYREANHVLKLEGESIVSGLGGASFGFGFYPTWREALWQSPYHNSFISDVDRDRIVINIKEAIKFMDGLAVFE